MGDQGACNNVGENKNPTKQRFTLSRFAVSPEQKRGNDKYTLTNQKKCIAIFREISLNYIVQNFDNLFKGLKKDLNRVS